MTSNCYKILINDRKYEDWKLYDGISLNEIEKIDIEPSSVKLFSSDIFWVRDHDWQTSATVELIRTNK